MDKHKEICINAGIVLQAMNNTHVLTYHELKEKCSLSDLELGMAIGWLVHENKITYLSDSENGKLHLNYYLYF